MSVYGFGSIKVLTNSDTPPHPHCLRTFHKSSFLEKQGLEKGVLDVCFASSWLTEAVLLRKPNQSPLLRKVVYSPPPPGRGCFDGYSACRVVLLLFHSPFENADMFLHLRTLCWSSPAATLPNQPASVLRFTMACFPKNIFIC